MSYVEVFAVHKDGDVMSYDCAHNNHGFAPLVWNTLGDQYNVPRNNSYPLMMDQLALKALWDKQGKGELARQDDILLGATFDFVWVGRGLMLELIEACRAFHLRHIVPNKFVDTINRTADIIERMTEDLPDALGVAFNMCSANSSFWSIYLSEEDDHRPYNILTDKEHPGSGEKHWELKL